MDKITLVIPYYNHEDMFKKHIEYWSRWHPKVAKWYEVIVVDDGSPLKPLKIKDKVPLNIRAYRILDNIVWNTSGADNLAFSVATTPWVFRTDIDLVTDHRLSRVLFETAKESNKLYFPYRTKTATSGTRRFPHCNSFLISKDKFWKIGGYNEDFAGGWGYADSLFLYLAHKIYNMTDVNIDPLFPLIYFLDGGSGEKKGNGAFNDIQFMHKVDNNIHHNGPILRFKWEKIYENIVFKD